MPKITRENAQHFRQLALAARKRNIALRSRAKDLAHSILHSDPRTYSRERIAVQLSLLHDCIIVSMGHVQRGSTKGVRLNELIEAQRSLLLQAERLVGGKGCEADAELEKMIQKDPEVVLEGVKEAASGVVTEQGQL